MPHPTTPTPTPATALGVLVARARGDLAEVRRPSAEVINLRTPLDLAALEIASLKRTVALLTQRIDRASEEMLRPRNVDYEWALNVLLGHLDIPVADVGRV